MHRFFVIFTCLWMTAGCFAQTGTLKGTITHADSKKPIAGVSVSLVGAEVQTLTDSKGRYQVKGINPGTYTVTVTKKGFKTQRLTGITIRAGKSTVKNIKLYPYASWKSHAQYQIDDLVEDTRSEKEEAADVLKLKSNESQPSPPRLLSLSAPKTDEESADTEASPPPSEPVLLRPPPPVPMAETDIPELPETYSAPEADPGEDVTLTAKPPSQTKPPSTSEKPATDPKFSSPHPPKDDSPSTPRAAPPKPPASSGLRAGFADDNEQFNYYLNFLNRYSQKVQHKPYDVRERIRLIVQDPTGKSIPNAGVKLHAPGSDNLLLEGRTYPDGSFYFFPKELLGSAEEYSVSVDIGDTTVELIVHRQGPRVVEIPLDYQPELEMTPTLDIVYILDTTGSMREEIQRLLATIGHIRDNLSVMKSKPRVRFGMVLYRDKGSNYVTRMVPLTENINSFTRELRKVTAAGGGDIREDLESALKVTMMDMNWSPDGLRLGFIITDAPPQLKYRGSTSYIRSTLEAKRQGIKLFTLGTGGLDIQGEFVLRQISQLTAAKYLFLTYGETGESEGGAPGSVSHHTGANYETDKLEALIIRLAKEELGQFTGKPLPAGDDHFLARPITTETKEETLKKLFSMAIGQLIDYATYRLETGATLGVLPISARQSPLALNAEYFTEQLILSLGSQKTFTLVARKDLQSVVDEQKLQLSGLVDDDQVSEIGKLLGAENLLHGELFNQDGNQVLFLKLLRVETGEILSVTKLIIEPGLGL